MAHSPAPWKWRQSDALPSYVWLIDTEGATIVDSVQTEPDDAALIAAAPELLESCKIVLDKLKWWQSKRIPINHHEGYLISFTDEIALIESVIAKAQPTQNELPPQIPPESER